MFRPLASLLILVSLCPPLSGMKARLRASLESPIPIGTKISLVAEDPGDGTYWHRFRVRPPGGEFTLIRDFGPDPLLNWSPMGREGTYEIELTSRNVDTGESEFTSQFVDTTSLAVGDTGGIAPTTHPLVFVYSAPSCDAGLWVRVEFQSGRGVQSTPSVPCDPGFSRSFYLAGLYQNTDYTARHVVEGDASQLFGDSIPFRSGAAEGVLYPASVLQPASFSNSNRILLGNGNGAPTATDLNGEIVWYVSGIPFITRVDQNGYFWTVVDPNQGPAFSVLRKINLVGDTVLETNAGRLNEQLRALNRREITGFHHEALTLPDGRVAVLAGVEQVLSGVQGDGPVNILGDMILVLDSDLNVVWTWDTFDHLDVRRAARFNETCRTAMSGCPPFYLTAEANDWTHGNSIQPTPDGQLLYSTRHQDWLVKIDYSGGLGDGHVIWRLGRDGDFYIVSNTPDPYPWFSHQHDGNFDPADPTSLLVFDNGNSRIIETGFGNSRGQVLKLDEENRIATLLLNADLGVYAAAVGSAQRLANGNYFFDAGFVAGVNNAPNSFFFEVDPSGQIVYNATIQNLAYRAFRMTDIYNPN